MATEILTSRFTTAKIEKSTKLYQIVAAGHFKSKQQTLLIDYHTGLIDFDVDSIVEIILYRGHVSDEMVPKEYQYVMLGKMYSAEEDQYIGSFGGLRMILTGKITGLDDRCEISIAIRKL